VFPNGAGNLENHGNIIKRILCPVQIAADVTVPVKDDSGKQKRDKNGKPIVQAKYTGWPRRGDPKIHPGSSRAQQPY
jgi:integrase